MFKALKARLYGLLRWSEKYTHLDMVYLASGSFWMGVGQVSNALSSFASALLFGNLLPRDTFGIYKYILTLASTLGNLSLTGLRTALTRSTSLNYEGDLLRGFWLSLRWSLLMIAASFVLGLYYVVHNNYALGAGMFMFGSLSPFLNAANLYSFYLNGAKRFKQENFYSIGRDWIPLVALGVTLFLTHNIIVISLVYFLSNTGAACLFFLQTLRGVPPHSRTSSDLVSYSTHLSAMSLFSGVVGQADNILVFHYLGATDLAVYSFASAIPNQFQSAFKTLYTLALPKFSLKESGDLKKIIFKRVLQAGLLGIAATIGYIISAPYLFTWFFPHYLDAVPYTQLLAFTILLSAVGSITGVYFDSQSEVRKKYVISIFSNLTKLVLMVILLKELGMIGVILGILISWVLTFLLQLGLIRTDK